MDPQVPLLKLKGESKYSKPCIQVKKAPKKIVKIKKNITKNFFFFKKNKWASVKVKLDKAKIAVLSKGNA